MENICSLLIMSSIITLVHVNQNYLEETPKNDGNTGVCFEFLF